jgi:hypothetical protein
MCADWNRDPGRTFRKKLYVSQNQQASPIGYYLEILS